MCKRSSSSTNAPLIESCAQKGAWHSVKNIPYVPGGDHHSKQELDVYVPGKSHDSSCATHDLKPVVIFIHGGGWQRGDRSYHFGMYGNVGQAFAQQGYVCPVISYRLSRPPLRQVAPVYVVISCLWGALALALTHDMWLSAAFAALVLLICFLVRMKVYPSDPVRHPTHLHDCAAAVKWVKEHISEFGGDVNRIALCGHSAGGHLSSMLTLDSQYFKAAGVSPCTVKAVVSISGVYSAQFSTRVVQWFFRKLFLEPAFGTSTAPPSAFPMFHATPRRGRKRSAPTPPPFCLLNAGWDMPGLKDQARTFKEALSEAGVRRVEEHIIPRTGHISIVRGIKPSSAAVHPVMQIAREFLERELAAARCVMVRSPPTSQHQQSALAFISQHLRPDGEAETKAETEGAEGVKEGKYSSPAEWAARLQDGGVIVVASKTSESSFAEATAAVLVAYRRAKDLPEGIDVASNLHVWLCATSPAHRRQGMMKAGFQKLYGCQDGLRSITVATKPDAYPGMVKFLEGQGFTQYAEEGGKVRLVKRLEE